jgi:hypothetical protein
MLLAAGCSKAPESEVQSVTEAADQARMEEIDQYAPETFNMAIDSLNASKVEIEKQSSKFAPLRGYGRSRELITASNLLLEQARTEAIAKKEELRIQDSTLVSELATRFEEANAALAKAPKGKGTKADIELMKAELAAIKTTYDEAVTAYNDGMYIESKNKLDAVSEKLNTIMTDIQKARAIVGTSAGGI